MSRIDILKTELTDDPLAIGYSGMDDATAAASLNDTGTGRTLPVDTFSGADIFEMIDIEEFEALDPSVKVRVDRVTSLGGSVLVSPSSKARAVLLAAFALDTKTRNSMIAAVSRDVSRGVELGVGFVSEADVQDGSTA